MTIRAAVAAKGVVLWCGVGLVALGCGPSSATLRNISSGDLPCGQADIGVYGRTTHNGEDTWTATCRGQLYTCSRPEGGGDAKCVAEGRPSDNVAEPTAPHAPPPQSVAPTGAAGFTFGASLEESQKVCEAAGLSWSAAGKEWACSGAPTAVGFDPVVNLRMCSGQLCGISLVHRPSGDWVAFIGNLKDRLEAKYGPPTESDDLVPRICRPPEEFVGCVDRGELKLRFSWAWTGGERVALVVGRVQDQASTVRIDYGRLKSAL